VRPDLVIVLPPVLNDLTSMLQMREPVFAEAFIPELAVEVRDHHLEEDQKPD